MLTNFANRFSLNKCVTNQAPVAALLYSRWGFLQSLLNTLPWSNPPCPFFLPTEIARCTVTRSPQPIWLSLGSLEWLAIASGPQ